MARRKKRGDPHVRLYGWVMKTPAWRSLHAGPIALLVLLYSFYNGTNNGALFLSVRDAADRLHVSVPTVRQWFDELIKKGFVMVARDSKFSLKTKEARSWTLTEFPVGNELATKEFARWRPADEIQNTVQNSCTDGAKNFHRSADLSPPKQASQCKILAPSQPDSSTDGANGLHTDTVTRGTANKQNASISSKPPTSTPAQQIGAADTTRKDVARRWGEQMRGAFEEAQETGDYTRYEELQRDHAAWVARHG